MEQIEVMRTQTIRFASAKNMAENIAKHEERGWAVRSITDSPQMKVCWVVFEDNR